ncbi:MAG: glycosyltransferase family 39 protein [Bacteroidetes bacterium]|nr:glycosyltransferase family 39 protein [Bacteroidota bacterium]
MTNPLKQFCRNLTEPLRSEGKLNIPLVVIFLLINGIVLLNSRLHAPWIGYDANAHISYIKALSAFRLVSPAESQEFFSPPLPYFLPAIFYAITGKLILAAKFAQLLNVVVSILLTWFLLKSCDLLSSKPWLKIGTLAFLGILPVYYRTFAFVRGEPYIALFAVLILYFTILILVRKKFTRSNILLLGLAMGSAALSRQWGILLIPAVMLFGLGQWFVYRRFRKEIVKSVSVALLVSLLCCGWFYCILKVRYGAYTAFSGAAATNFTLSNQPPKFFFGSGIDQLFCNPVDPGFSNQFFPVFYSEVWGDYWGFFVNYGSGTNVTKFVNGYDLHPIYIAGKPLTWMNADYFRGGTYLGRVNLVSLFPTVLVLLAVMVSLFVVSRRKSTGLLRMRRKEVKVFLLLSILATLSGYFWFLIAFPSLENGCTIKATYVLQIMPSVALLVGNFLERIRNRSVIGYRLIMAGLAVVFVHNIFTMLSHYWFLGI